MSISLVAVADGIDTRGKYRTTQFTVTGDTSYPSGGYAISPANIGFTKILGAVMIGANSAAAGGILPVWNQGTGKLQLFYPTGGGVAAPGSLADPIVNTGAVTASAVDAATPNIVPGRGKELLATTNVSTLSYIFEFIGY